MFIQCSNGVLKTHAPDGSDAHATLYLCSLSVAGVVVEVVESFLLPSSKAYKICTLIRNVKSQSIPY